MLSQSQKNVRIQGWSVIFTQRCDGVMVYQELKAQMLDSQFPLAHSKLAFI